MEPYYRDDHVTLYHGDCREIDAWLTADVLVTDPPYGIAYESNFNRDGRNVKVGRPVKGDADAAVRDAALSAWDAKPAAVFGRWDATRPPGQIRARLVWDKGDSVGMGDLSLPWGRSDEEIYIYGKGWQGKRSGSVVRVQMYMSGDHRRPDHPTPKPIGLMERVIVNAPPGVIADPFAGSGATLVAARNLDRRVIGVEVEERYCEVIARRLDQSSFDFGEAS